MSKSKYRRIPVPARVEEALDVALDKALAIQRPVVQNYLGRLRAKNPDLTPAQVVKRLERHYQTAVIGIGGASGAAAAVPGAGTAASLASGAVEITAFVSASAMYVLALAELHGVPVSDPDVRRALVLAVLVGEGGEAVIAGTAEGGKHWAQVIGRTASSKASSKASPKDSGALHAVNGRLGRLLITRFGARQGALMFGRALPLGIGAGVGAAGNAALAHGAISAARKAFGPAPKTFAPRVIDVGPASDTEVRKGR